MGNSAICGRGFVSFPDLSKARRWHKMGLLSDEGLGTGAGGAGMSPARVSKRAVGGFVAWESPHVYRLHRVDDVSRLRGGELSLD
jgi:hypothetical protein